MKSWNVRDQTKETLERILEKNTKKLIATSECLEKYQTSKMLKCW